MNIYLKALTLVVITSLVFIADVYTKNLILEEFFNNDNFVIITTFLNIVFVKNYGISFGLMNDPHNSKWLFIILSLSLIFVLFLWFIRSSNKVTISGLSMIIGGALGNLYDRIIHGSVIDFIDFHYANLHYPAFNVADSLVVIGVIFLLLAPSETPVSNKLKHTKKKF